MTAVELEDMNKMESKESAATMLPQNGSVPRAEGAKLPQYLNTVAASLIVLATGTVIGWTAPALPFLLGANSTLPITNHEASWVGSLMAIGALVGALPAGTIADMIGRKLFISSLTIPFVASWVMIYFAKGVSLLYVARLVAGAAVGSACSVVPMYITEIAEDSVRGTLGMAFPFAISSGILGSAIVATFFSYDTLTLFSIIAAVSSLLGACFVVETPYYHMKKGNKDKAEACLLKLRGRNYNARKDIEQLAQSVFDSGAPKVSFREALRTRQSKLAIFMSFGLMMFHQCSGISILSFFGGTIIRDTEVMDPETGNLIITMTSMSAMIVAGYVVKSIGRRTILQASIVVCGMCLTYLGYFFHVKSSEEPSGVMKVLSLASLCLFGVSYSLGIGPIPWLMTHELLPSDVKAIAGGWITGLNWILAFGTTKLFQPLLDSIGPAATFWVFAGSCYVGFFFFTFVVIETKGKSLVEIQRELAGKKRVKNTDEC